MTPFLLFLYIVAASAGAGIFGAVLMLLYLALLFVRGAIAGAVEKV